MPERETVQLAARDASAAIALTGAEPVRWQVGGRDLLWHGDPVHWSYSAPILFPVVGSSRDGVVLVQGAEYPMPQHGFARLSRFDIVDRDVDRAHLRLEAGDATREHYPFRFRLDVTVTLGPEGLRQDFTVQNMGEETMPYALGVHPAFPWPLGGPDKDGHCVVFEAEERPEVPEVAPGGLLARSSRVVPIADRVLPLEPDLFSEALVFLDARSRAVSFGAPDESAVDLRTDGFRHLAVWSRPTAPFLSLEAWTGHADWEDAGGELAERASMIGLAPGESRRHRVTMSYRPA